MRYAYAGDREISVHLLEFLMAQGCAPLALLVSEGKGASHAQELVEKSKLPKEVIFRGNEFKKKDAIARLKSLNLDYIIGIHFPYLVPKAVLDLPKVGVVNLHPAYLPYNKGWHTPSWAIVEGKPYGATLHFMEEALDQGDIIHQKQVTVHANDTANSLYQRALQLEEEVFKEAFAELRSLKPRRKPQAAAGTAHLKKDLEELRKIELEKTYTAVALLNKLRGLTTNDEKEAAYFEYQGKKIGVQVCFKEF
ncbi:formyltransferase family protein [Pedobacter sp.]|uniref:formyltransferase family protein n=1 Tax=Pedobacter sp. TaxID=1411316 RepID=UPI003D7F4BEF